MAGRRRLGWGRHDESTPVAANNNSLASPSAATVI